MSEYQIAAEVARDMAEHEYRHPEDIDSGQQEWIQGLAEVAVHSTMKWLIIHAERTPTDRPELEGWHNEGHGSNNDPILDWLIRMRDQDI